MLLTWDGYGLRIMYPYHVSSAESPPERAMDYALSVSRLKKNFSGFHGSGKRIFRSRETESQKVKNRLTSDAVSGRAVT